MQKKLYSVVVIVLLSVITAFKVNAQVAIHLSNPLGLLSKARIKIEYRLDTRHALLLSTAGYWGWCPGLQGYAEYRNYHFVTRRTELFYYGKLGGGAGVEFGIAHGDTGPFTYALAGAGMGYHFNMGRSQRFFMDLAFGLKGCQQITVAPEGNDLQFFYISGPGSVVDINFHFGFTFSNRHTANRQ